MAERALDIVLCAPVGRDAPLTAEVFARLGLTIRPVRAIDEFCDALERGADVAIMTDEIFADERVFDRISMILGAEPTWSNLPLVVLTRDHAASELIVNRLGPRANVTAIERPVRLATLTSVLRSAMRSRERQLEVRGLMEKLADMDQKKSELLAVVSHDLRNLISPIGMTAGLLSRPNGDADVVQVRRRAETIQRGAERVNRLLDDLLDMSAIESGHLPLKKERHQLESLVEEAITLLQPAAAEKSIELIGRVHAMDPIVCDRTRLVQVLTNLIGNALKFTPPHGSIHVEADRNEERHRFFVRDTGPGIQADALPKLFERYWQEKPGAKKGLGLGLFIASGIVRAHGGAIEVTSELGRGTTFTFTIPATDVGG